MPRTKRVAWEAGCGGSEQRSDCEPGWQSPLQGEVGRHCTLRGEAALGRKKARKEERCELRPKVGMSSEFSHIGGY